jgi:hypothetical protein
VLSLSQTAQQEKERAFIWIRFQVAVDPLADGTDIRTRKRDQIGRWEGSGNIDTADSGGLRHAPGKLQRSTQKLQCSWLIGRSVRSEKCVGSVCPNPCRPPDVVGALSRSEKRAVLFGSGLTPSVWKAWAARGTINPVNAAAIRIIDRIDPSSPSGREPNNSNPCPGSDGLQTGHRDFWSYSSICFISCRSRPHRASAPTTNPTPTMYTRSNMVFHPPRFGFSGTNKPARHRGFLLLRLVTGGRCRDTPDGVRLIAHQETPGEV